MGRKRHTAEEIVVKLRKVDVLTAQGHAVADAIQTIGVTKVTYYRWRSEYGGLKGDQVKRLKELETENNRRRRAVRSLMLYPAELRARQPHHNRFAVKGTRLRRRTAKLLVVDGHVAI
jgi:putative transposase